MSVGTGSPFEILWDTRKVRVATYLLLNLFLLKYLIQQVCLSFSQADLKTEREIDVYDFLNLVINSAKMEDIGTDCLGEDIEDLQLEDEYMGLDLSPMHESGLEKPSFEDEVEFDEGDDELFSNQVNF